MSAIISPTCSKIKVPQIALNKFKFMFSFTKLCKEQAKPDVEHDEKEINSLKNGNKYKPL